MQVQQFGLLIPGQQEATQLLEDLALLNYNTNSGNDMILDTAVGHSHVWGFVGNV